MLDTKIQIHTCILYRLLGNIDLKKSTCFRGDKEAQVP